MRAAILVCLFTACAEPEYEPRQVVIETIEIVCALEATRAPFPKKTEELVYVCVNEVSYNLKDYHGWLVRRGGKR